MFTDTFRGLQPQPFNPPIPYRPGHEYFTLIQYTNGQWGICAVDLQDTTTYRCEPSAVGGTYMRKVRATGIFAENWNANSDWFLGNPGEVDPTWTAHDAMTYVGDIPYKWSSQIPDYSDT